ncbi:hypothetical protein llap_21466 [Limosa lapponica baueri]|uniref:Uncharacterized protein n=1 Tax=Limosa lapponica baueri TaxID=1758121 RepID=A0A2I0T366_LIMLA|nr:hypothetical protein llap_21466 [Limosa lapponica baueri]
MIFSSSRFSFSKRRDFSSSLLLVEEPVFMVSCCSDCHSPRVMRRRICNRPRLSTVCPPPPSNTCTQLSPADCHRQLHDPTGEEASTSVETTP